LETERGLPVAKITMGAFVLLIIVGGYFVYTNVPGMHPSDSGGTTVTFTSGTKTRTVTYHSTSSSDSSSITAQLNSTSMVNSTSTSSAAITSNSTSSTTATTTNTTTTQTIDDLCDSSSCAPLLGGWLHTEPHNTNIYNSKNEVVQLVGVNAVGLELGTGTDTPDSCENGYALGSLNFTTSEFNNIAYWGFNVVRLPISWENLEPTAPTVAANGTWVHSWNKAYLDEIDYVVGQFGDRGISVILDMSQGDVSPAFQQVPASSILGFECEGWGNPTWLYPAASGTSTAQDVADAMCSFFMDQSMVGYKVPLPIQGLESVEQMLALRYLHDNTVVGLDIFDQPYFESGTPCGSAGVAANLLTKFDSDMAGTISATNPHMLIIFEDALSPLTRGVPILGSSPSAPNVVYSLQVYSATWADAQGIVSAAIENSRNWGVPIYVSEFDAFGAGSTAPGATVDPNWQLDTQSMLSTFDLNGMSWTYYSYYSLSPLQPSPVAGSVILSVLQEGMT
jgi:Cellulase (glycosyl hydrolase family 5)